jgi:hypothetical protein
MGSWWRTMRIRQTKLPPIRSSLRELLGTAQVFAKPGEPVPASSLLLRATMKTALSQRNYGSAYAKATADKLHGCHGWDSSFVIHSSFGIFQTIPTESSPQTISPGARYRGRSPHQPPVMMAMGIGPPQTTIKPTIRKQLKTTK